MTHQIVYASEAATPMQTEALEEILQHARRRNAERGITGALVYVDGVFLQILEGPAATVAALMARISQDVRHETVTVLREGEIPAAVFSDWSMAYASATPEQMARWAGLNAATPLPETLSGLRQHPAQVTQVTDRILQVLAHPAPAAAETPGDTGPHGPVNP